MHVKSWNIENCNLSSLNVHSLNIILDSKTYWEIIVGNIASQWVGTLEVFINSGNKKIFPKLPDLQ